MRRSVLSGLALFAALAAPRAAHANECNLYQPEQFGEIRVGCSLTIFVLPELGPSIPTITRGGQTLEPTVAQDQLPLKITWLHYASEDSCELLTSYENRTFDRYVVAWPDLQAGDEIVVNGGYHMVVPSAGDCGKVEPFFACADGVKFCDYDTMPPDDSHPNDVDPGGCAAGGGSMGWLAIAGAVALATCGRRRSRASSRR